MSKFPQYENLNLSEISKEILAKWAEENTFEKSVSLRDGAKTFTFYEGPPSANGMPGIHHVMARTIKDIFCRYQTMKGFRVERKGGWDTHGLPIELSVEKSLGITKEDIGKPGKPSVEEYNAACRQEVMKYKDKWEEVTTKMGYWVDMKDPYITFDNNYIESVWYLLGELYKKQLLYKGYTIQPYSWAAGTGLSSHELNQPGCYKNIKDTSITAQFKVIKDKKSEFLFSDDKDVFFLAWTTTPWTLPSNCALAVGKNIEYALVTTYQPYMGNPIKVILALDLVHKYFHEKAADIAMEDYKHGDRYVPYKIEKTFKGSDLTGIRYEQLMPYVKPDGKAFEVIIGDFVTTDDGAGIVHTASLFGADDFRVCNQNNIAAIYVKDADGNNVPLVDKEGKFVKEVTDFAGMHVKTKEDQEHPEKSTDLAIALKLKKEGKAFKIEKIEHSYPHCWRTDQPVIYYPLDSWFVKTTAAKDKMIALNKTINWKPESTGTGRFGNWLENMVDWNLSRSRFWGVPLPIWRTEDGKEELCIGSYEELDKEVKKAVANGIMTEDDLKKSKWNTAERDIHKPYCDNIFLVSPGGKKMFRESDLIDVWFDSGSMPYAQWHYPFENKKKFQENFPADFIAEGVDQTRGWFFTLHAIASMLFDSVAFKNVVSNGLVLDKHGNKMSKRLGNAVDPFKVLDQYGADATRWYMISNAQPWDNLKFDEEGITEVQRKLFRALYNTYAFYSLYANIDGFTYSEKEIPISHRPELDQWILSVLNSLIKRVDEFYATYEPMRAAREIESFVTDQLSNWYVRLSRRRFWKGEYSEDKIAAFQTLYNCLETIAKLIAPIAPFYSERLFTDLNSVSGKEKVLSIHHSLFPVHKLSFEEMREITAQYPELIKKSSKIVQNENVLEVDESVNNTKLKGRMEIAQRICSLTLSLRKKHQIPVRQPLNRIIIPVGGPEQLRQEAIKDFESVKELILSEVNVKRIEYSDYSSLEKNIKPIFETLGKKYGRFMKQIAMVLSNFSQDEITKIEYEGAIRINLSGEEIFLSIQDVQITIKEKPGLPVAKEGNYTVELDTTLTKELKEEGIARELVNRIQNLRKEKNYEVTDKIKLQIKKNAALESAIKNNFDYICSEILATSFEMVDNLEEGQAIEVEVADNLSASIFINKSN